MALSFVEVECPACEGVGDAVDYYGVLVDNLFRDPLTTNVRSNGKRAWRSDGRKYCSGKCKRCNGFGRVQGLVTPGGSLVDEWVMG